MLRGAPAFLERRMTASTIEFVGAVLLACALVHTFASKYIGSLGYRFPRHAKLLHLLGEIEGVFGLWASVLVIAMALLAGSEAAIAYVDSRQFTEPLFVFVVMVVAASRPVLDAVSRTVDLLAHFAPVHERLARAWLGLGAVPILGSFITEPAAMTLAALILAPQVFRPGVPEWMKYGAIGVLFVNVSIGGTLTAYAAPPVLMVAATWQWDTAFMASTFGWRAAIAVVINASAAVFLLRRHLRDAGDTAAAQARPVPLVVSLIHLAFLGAVVGLAHHPALFLGTFLLFIGFTQAYDEHQSPLILREALLVGFFLAGLIVLGGVQQWWLEPLISGLEPITLFFSAMTLTAITDNAALTYLGSLIPGMSDTAKYMLVAGAVAGGGLTVIANAPNPAGVALLRRGFKDGSISLLGLLVGALAPTATAAVLFLA